MAFTDFGFGTHATLSDVFSTVSQTFIDHLLRLDPRLEDEASRRFLHYLLFPSWYDEMEEGVIADYGTLARHFNQEALAKQKRFAGCKVLDEFKMTLGSNQALFESFSYTGFNHRTHFARVVHAPIATTLQSLVERELTEWRPSAKSSELLDFFTLTPRPFRAAMSERAALDAKCQPTELELQMMPQASLELMTHLNAKKSNVFAGLVARNFSSAFSSALETGDYDARRQQLAMLYRISDQPKPYYRFSRNLCTSRIFPANASMLTLPGHLRRTLTAGCIECDLQNSQLVIVAKRWNLPKLNDFVATGQSIWKVLFDYLGLPESEEVKTLFKHEFLYPTIFGRTKEYAIYALTKRASKYKKLWPHLSKHPLMAELIEGRKAKCEQIVKDGGLTTILGSRLELKADKFKTAKEIKDRVNSILAHDAQETELALMLPIVELERQTQDFSIILHQHDGMTVKINKAGRERQMMKRVTKAVEQNARNIGLPAVLVWKE